MSAAPDAGLPGHPRTRWLLPGTVLLVAALAGFTARSLWPKAAGHASAAALVPVSTAQVVRTDVAQRQVVPGTLGYLGTFNVTNELPNGVVTWLPPAGQVVRRGQDLYRLAGQPVTLLYGQVPAWRSFVPGMTPGADVRELDENLVALGFDPGHQITPGDQTGWATTAAIELWQQAHGLVVTGSIPLGEVVFLPGSVQVAGLTAATGTPAGTGAPVLTGTSTVPSVSVSLAVGGPAVQPGDSVLVTLPDGTTTVHGTVSSVGRVATLPSPSSPGAQGASGSSSAQAPAIPVTISLGRARVASLDQAPVQVTITEQEHQGVLAVPVTALLALPGGNYAVRAAAGPAHRLITVTTGLFDDATGMVEVSGAGLSAGLTVEMAQG